MTLHHDTVVRPKERDAVILAQFDREMARIKECDHRWEDGMEVSCLHSITSISTDRQVECISAPAHYSSSATFQVVSPEASRSSPPRSNSDDSSSVPEWCASRVRHGRRGVLHIDRRWSLTRDELLSYPQRSTSSATVDRDAR